MCRYALQVTQKIDRMQVPVPKVLSQVGGRSGRIVRLLACGGRGPGFEHGSHHLDFRD